MNLAPGQFFLGGFDGTTPPPLVRKLIQHYRIGGFVLFKRNIENAKQVRSLIKSLQRLADYPLFFGVDQEGGTVFRLGAPFTQFPPMAVVGEYYRKTKDIKTVVEVGRVLAREVRAVGFNWDYAPVLDVHSNPKNPVIGKRAFSPDPLIIIRCGAAIIKGLHSEGVLSCVKHFPGHGGTEADSHHTLPILKDPGRLLWKRDVLPYRRLIPRGVIRAIMTAHVRYPDFDEKNCATLSSYILTDMLRKRLQYKGLIVSDDMLMKAIAGRLGVAQASLDFFAAGGDMAMICHQPDLQVEAIEKLAEALTSNRILFEKLRNSRRRIENIRRRFLVPFTYESLRVIGCAEHRAVAERVLAGGASSE